MKTFIFIYEGFASFETIFTGLFMKSGGDVVTVSKDYSVITSSEGFKYVPDKLLSNINPDEVDAFVIPGGNPGTLLKDNELVNLLKELQLRNKLIGAICAAPVHLANSGILKGKNYTCSLGNEFKELFSSSKYIEEDVVVDGNIVTAKGNAYIDFAMEIGKMLNVFEDTDEIQETVNYFKNIAPLQINQ